VITLVPAAWKAVVRAISLTSLEDAKVWVQSMVMQAVHLTFMAEEACVG